MKDIVTYALIGRPNSGKTTIFNLLTGQFQKMGNFSGISVDCSEGTLLGNPSLTIIDLPGIFTLNSPQGEDEKVTQEYLNKIQDGKLENVVPIFVMDCENLLNSLALYLQASTLFPKIGVILTKTDNFDDIRTLDTLINIFEKNLMVKCIDVQLGALNSLNDEQNKVRLKYFIHSLEINIDKEIKHPEVYSFGYYLAQAKKILAPILDKEVSVRKLTLSRKIDQFLVHPFLGIFIFTLIFYSMFHILYFFTTPIMDFIETSLFHIGVKITSLLSFIPASYSWVTELLIDGLWGSFTSVVIFVPQIFILFVLISILEQSGYLSRASIVTNKWMGRFGLSGKSFVPYMSALACAVPAIMSTRTLSDKKERMLTILTLPFMSCSARIPVYLLLVGTFISAPFRPLALFVLFFLGTFVALLTGLILRKYVFKGKSEQKIIDLPFYKIPQWKIALRLGFIRSGSFIKKAGTIILMLSMCIWALGRFPEKPIENSYLGKIGKTIEPILKPIGFDWKISIGILCAMGARELFIGGLSAVYSIEDDENTGVSLRKHLVAEKNFTPATACSLLIFMAIACQCVSTLGMIRAETKSTIAPIGVFIYSLLLAYLCSFMIYRLLL